MYSVTQAGAALRLWAGRPFGPPDARDPHRIGITPTTVPPGGKLLTFVCDWCKRPKAPGQRWILGFAAERMGAAGVQREISIASAWSERSADHPLAVHFCCEAHKQAYIMALFEQNPAQQPRRRVSQQVAGPAVAETAVDVEPEERPRPAGRRPRARRRMFTAADEIRCRGWGIRLQKGPAAWSGPAASGC